MLEESLLLRASVCVDQSCATSVTAPSVVERNTHRHWGRSCSSYRPVSVKLCSVCIVSGIRHCRVTGQDDTLHAPAAHGSALDLTLDLSLVALSNQTCVQMRRGNEAVETPRSLACRAHMSKPHVGRRSLLPPKVSVGPGWTFRPSLSAQTRVRRAATAWYRGGFPDRHG